MAIVVQIVGAILAVGGLVGLVYGIDMLPTERGVAGTISSVTAFSAGVVTVALGLVIQRLDALAGSGVRTAAPRVEPAAPFQPAAAAAPREEPAVPVEDVAPQPEAPQRPRIEPRLTEADLLGDLPELAPKPVARPVVEPPAPEVKIEAPRAERPKFSLPSFKLGAGAVAAGAAVVATKASGMLDKTADAAASVVETVTPVKTAAVESDPPVEVLTPVDDLPALDAGYAGPAPDLSVYADVPMPVEEPALPVVKPVEDDPFASFEQELDKLIPLKSAKKAKGKTDEPEPVAAPVAEPEPVIAEEPVPPQVIADAADLAPPQPTPAPGAEVVGAYESGGAKYTMYSDGSVIAEAEGQQLFFKSLEELREFIDGGVKG